MSKPSAAAALHSHRTLNRALWDGEELRPEVRVRLLRTALMFYRFLDIDGLVVTDIVLTGSNAAYAYNRHSDIDVHLIVDFVRSPCPGLADNLFTTKKALWSASHDVRIRRLPVELYVEDAEQPAKSAGLYSLLRGNWLRRAKPQPETADAKQVSRQVQAITAKIRTLLASAPAVAAIDELLAKLTALRRSGLARGGEFSAANLAFKAVRGEGWIEALWAARTRAQDASLSLPG